MTDVLVQAEGDLEWRVTSRGEEYVYDASTRMWSGHLCPELSRQLNSGEIELADVVCEKEWI